MENTNVINEEDLNNLVDENIIKENKDNDEIIDPLEYVHFTDQTVETIIMTAGRQFAKLQKAPDIEKFAKQYKNEVWGWLEMFGFKQELQKIRIKNIPGWMKLTICAAILTFYGFNVKVPGEEVAA